MKLGQAAMEQLKAEVTGCLQPGDEIVAAAPIALSGTVFMAQKGEKYLRKFFSDGFLNDSMQLFHTYGVGKIPEESQAWQLARQAGATALYPMGKGGVLSALWKMAEASQVGLQADLRKIPVRQESIEICERFDINPYRLDSTGALLLGIPAGEALVQTYRQMGLMAAVIGQTNQGNDRLLYSGENIRYLERPGQDEKERFLKEKEYLWQS